MPNAELTPIGSRRKYGTLVLVFLAASLGGFLVVRKLDVQVGRFFAAEGVCECAGTNNPYQDADGDCVAGPPFGDDCNDGTCDIGGGCAICDNNTFCEFNETHESCPADCPLDATPTPTGATPTPTEPPPCQASDVSVISFSGSGDSATVRNNSGTTCRIGLASYKVFDQQLPDFLITQELYDSEVKTVTDGQQDSLHVDLPDCAYQTDLFTGEALPGGGIYTGANLIDARILFAGGLCGGGPTPTPPPQTPTPTPTPTSTPTATPTPTPTGSPTPTPTPTATPTPTPTATPTPTPTPANPALSIQKTVRNVTQSSGEVESVNANPLDTVEFVIRISSTGSTAATVVVARDALPAGLTYRAGSTTIDGILASDGITAGGINIGDMAPGRSIVVRFLATVAASSFFSPGTTTLTNTVYVQGSNVPALSDTAFVAVVQGSNPSLSITKLGMNLTRNETTEHSPVYASPEEIVQFVVRVRSTGSSALTNVTVRDILPAEITYILGTARLGGQPLSDTLVTSGVSIGTLAAGQEVIITFSGRVAPGATLPSGTTTLINTVQVTATNVPTVTAQVPVIITNTTVVTQIPTGPGESLVLALIVSAITTLLYVGYAGTDIYRKREAHKLAKPHKDFDLR